MHQSIHRLKDIRQEYSLFRRRAFGIFLGISLLTIILLGRLVYLQVLQHDLYTTLARQNQLSLIPIEPSRGFVYDRKGLLLAENRPIFNLVIVPALVPHLRETISKLAKIIKIDANDIRQFEHQRRPHQHLGHIPLRLKLSEQEVARFSLNRYRFPGASIQAQMIRYYPKGDTFAAIVGYMGRINAGELKTLDPVNYSASEFIGKTGVERYYEAQLHGTTGYQQVETNVHGQILRILKQTQPIPGRNLVLTIDGGLQALAQQALGTQQGAVVALDPRNGEILAFVSSPSFDPNLFVSGIRQGDYDALKSTAGHPLYNRALRGYYHPGSTIKPFISIGALMDEMITPSAVIHDTGVFQIGGRGKIYHNFRRHAYGDVNLLQALMVSSDVYFYNLSMRMGINRIYASLKRFGFGLPTGIDLPDEGSGVLPSPQWKKKIYGSSWYPGDTLNCGIGQGFLLSTPLQLALAVSTIANWGARWQPRVLLRWEATGNHTAAVTKPTPLSTVEVPHAILSFIRSTMQHVVRSSGGTAERFFSGAPYTLAGKTGTAQVFSLKENERYDTKKIAMKLRDNSLFIAFAPVESPTIALAIVVQNSQVPAAQIARKLLDYYLIPPSPIPTITSREMISTQPTAVAPTAANNAPLATTQDIRNTQANHSQAPAQTPKTNNHNEKDIADGNGGAANDHAQVLRR